MKTWKIILSLTIVALFFLIPHTIFANPIWYGRVVRVEGDRAILEWRDIENKYYSSCIVKTEECTSLSQLPPATEVSVKAKGPVAALPSIYDKTTDHQTRSESKRFGAYVRSDTNVHNRKIVLVDGKTKAKYFIAEKVDFWNLLDDQPRVFRFSSDEANVAYVSDRDGYMSLYYVPLKNLSNEKMKGVKITNEMSVGDFIFADSKTLVYVANNKTDPYKWNLYSYDLISKVTTKLAEDLAYTTYLRQSGNSILFNRLSVLGTVPAMITSVHGGMIKDFTSSMTPKYDTSTIKYSALNVAGMEGVLMQSSSTTNDSPLIIWLHGGPYRQTSFIRHAYASYGPYDWMLEEVVSEGVRVLKLDYSGSYGYGRAYSEKIKGSVGKNDVDDVVRAANEFRNAGTKEIYVVGNSYGGYLALKAVSEYPEKFEGLMSINGVTDWGALTDYLKTSIFNILFNGIPKVSNKDLYNQASILKNLSNLDGKKIYIIQGDKDRTVPFFQSLIIDNALSAKNIDHEFLPIKGEDHVFAKDSSIETICKSVFEMMDLSKKHSCDLTP